MSSNHTVAESSNSEADRFKSVVEAYQTSMRSVIKAQTVFDPKTLHEEHSKIVTMVTREFTHDEIVDLSYLLTEHLFDILEEEEELTWLNSGENLHENYLCIYLTWDWVYVAGYTRKLGTVNINFGNDIPGFAAQTIHSDGKLAWSEEHYNLTEDNEGNTLEVGTLHGVINSMCFGDETCRNLMEELFERVKKSVEGKMKETISQVVLLTSGSFNYLINRKFLRDCCLKTGFKKTIIVSQTSLAAYGVFSNLQLHMPNPQDVSVVVVVIFYSHIMLSVYGCTVSESYINGSQLLASAYCYVSKESVKSGYNRALAQLPTKGKDSISYYVILKENNESYKEKFVDEVFSDEEKLTKSDNICFKELIEAFSHFCMTPFKQNDVSPFKHITSESTASASGAIGRHDALGSSELQLWIHTFGGKLYKIIALAEWTVKRLKKEFRESEHGQQDPGQLVIKYGAEVLKDDRILSSYEMEPDSVIQAKFCEEGPTRGIQLTGNCVADGGKLASKCSQCIGLHLILNHYKIRQNIV